tara:strand:+ start:35 stop:232 length:198 start_codon:yes stop_codon:yes gene_type:complete
MILTILNFEDGKVYQKDMTEEPKWFEQWETDEYVDYIAEKGFNYGNVEWMISKEDEGLTPIENHG